MKDDLLNEKLLRIVLFGANVAVLVLLGLIIRLLVTKDMFWPFRDILFGIKGFSFV